MEWIDLISFNMLIPLTLLLGFAPFFPRPHIYEKLTMLKEGTLKKPLDIFDFIYHLSPFILLIIKVAREFSS